MKRRNQLFVAMPDRPALPASASRPPGRKPVILPTEQAGTAVAEKKALQQRSRKHAGYGSFRPCACEPGG
jgi:hypothetical protein